MKQWLMTQKIVALNTMFRKTPANQATYRTPEEAEKQLDYILVNRKYQRWSKDAETNDMIHMGSDHRSVMAQFVIPAKEKKVPAQRSQLDVKTAETSIFEGRYQEFEKGVTERSGKEHEETAAAKQEHAATAATCASKEESEAFAGARHISDTDAAAATASRNPAATAAARKEAAAEACEVSKKIKKCIKDKKTRKTRQKSKTSYEEMKGTKNVANIKSAKRRNTYSENQEHERRSHNIKERYC